MKTALAGLAGIGILSAVALVPLSYAGAHSSGASLEAVSGEYIIDIGYEPGDMYVGGRMVLDMELNDSDRNLTDFSRVWLRVARDKETLLATGVGKARLGPTTFMIKIPETWEGDITLHVRYEGEDGTLADAKFPLTIAPPYDRSSVAPWAIPLGAGITLGALFTGAFVMVRRRWW